MHICSFLPWAILYVVDFLKQQLYVIHNNYNAQFYIIYFLKQQLYTIHNNYNVQFYIIYFIKLFSNVVFQYDWLWTSFHRMFRWGSIWNKTTCLSLFYLRKHLVLLYFGKFSTSTVISSTLGKIVQGIEFSIVLITCLVHILSSLVVLKYISAYNLDEQEHWFVWRQ